MGRAAASANTPMMRQYLSFKDKYPDALLFFRMGDFYEMFFSDAEVAAEELGLTLTTRDRGKENPIPMAGVPFHAAEGYIAKLVRRGHRVAVCEQVGDPAKSKGLVERDVVEVVTPGTALNDSLVPDNANVYVAAAVLQRDRVGVAAADVTTGEFLVEDVPVERFLQEIAPFPVAEWILPEDGGAEFLPSGSAPVRRPGWWFETGRGRRELEEHFGVHSLRGFDGEDLGPALAAAGGLLDYLREVRGPSLPHFVRLKRFGSRAYMVLDETTRRNLELIAPLAGESSSLTLLATLDRTRTRPGARRLRAWLERPLLEVEAIDRRLDAVEEATQRETEAGELEGLLRQVRDLERLLGKAACGKANPRDVRALGEGAALTPQLKTSLARFAAVRWNELSETLPDLSGLGTRITEALVDEPPAQAGEGGVFREGYHAELDELRARARGGKEWILALQTRERERTGIPKLKVGYNKVFGYYLEVTAAHQHKVPEEYIRKQTLVNAERYVTPELKEEEERILGAEEKRRALELDLFAALREEVVHEAAAIQQAADVVADADALRSLAAAAVEHRFVRPKMVDEPVMRLRESRHPVVENLLPSGEFVPNDLDLHGAERQIAVITGPNMAGKSTYLRQAGLIAVMAQMGSFVPAEEAVVGLVDRVFTRVGASDNISRGQSTFMVEMEETATILNAATDRSLVLLDEVGRGTSTYDGLSIAWSVTEHLHERAGGKPRTLFATHYHELTALAGALPRVVNLTVQVKEWNGKVIFLRKIAPGAADQSYGIHVAQLAGLPPAVIRRAEEVLAKLEEGRFAREAGRDQAAGMGETQLTLFQPARHELQDLLLELDIDAITPLDALQLLHAWKEKYST